MIFLLLLFTILILLFIYMIEQDIISPSFIFCGVFLIAEINVITNITLLNVKFHVATVVIVTLGLLTLFLGALASKGITSHISIKRKSRNRLFKLTKSKFIVLFCFNILSIVYVLRNVYILTITRAGYRGSVLGALSVFAEVSKFQSIDMKVDIIATLVTALCEAEAYLLGFIIAEYMAKKKKIDKYVILCFVTAFLSTFCQGSRGGVFILIASIFDFIITYRNGRKSKSIGFKLIFKIIIMIVLAIFAFQIVGVVTGKMWDIPVYEYLSVYLGDPLINLDTKLTKGIQRTQIMGQASFAGLLRKIYGKFGVDLPKYTGLGEFQRSGTHNLGNVYTIFANLIADYGYIGCILMLFIIGALVELIYLSAIKNKNSVFAKVLCSYIMACVSFSFFSNKICENVTVYHIYMFIFVILIWRYLSCKQKPQKFGNMK